MHLRNVLFNRKHLCESYVENENENVIYTRSKSAPNFHIVKPNFEAFKRSIFILVT